MSTSTINPPPPPRQFEEFEEMAVQDEAAGRSHFTMLPNIVLTLGLSPYALALYVHLRKVTGESVRGVCFKKTATLASELKMSAGSISAAKKELAKPHPSLRGKALITIAEQKNRGGGKPRHHITLADIWAENFTAFVKPEAISPEDGASSYSEVASSPGEQAISPGEIKKNPSEEKPTKQTPTTQTPLRTARADAPAVVVCGKSRFSEEDCRRYADHLHASGQGVKNPGGFAKARYRDGTEDAQIAAWLATVESGEPNEAEAKKLYMDKLFEGSRRRGRGSYNERNEAALDELFGEDFGRGEARRPGRIERIEETYAGRDYERLVDESLA
ncbi:MAG: helix-turn-helix domain-containing protein [Rubrivivax sp.]|nr:helix-turn-helix domain-containing protein [Pyrinomonadaceae bacterium]